MSLHKTLDQLDFKSGQILLHEDHLVNILLNGGKISSEELEKIENWLNGHFSNSSFSTFIQVGDGSTIHSELIQLLISADRLWENGVDAFVVKNYTQKLVTELYLNFNLPLVPTRVFVRKSEALKWLRNHNAVVPHQGIKQKQKI